MINNCKFFPVICLVLSAELSSCSNHFKNRQAEVKEEGVTTVLPPKTQWQYRYEKVEISS